MSDYVTAVADPVHLNQDPCFLWLSDAKLTAKVVTEHFSIWTGWFSEKQAYTSEYSFFCSYYIACV